MMVLESVFLLVRLAFELLFEIAVPYMEKANAVAPLSLRFR